MGKEAETDPLKVHRTDGLKAVVTRYVSNLSSLKFALFQLMNALRFIQADEIEGIYQGFLDVGALSPPHSTPFRSALSVTGTQAERVSALNKGAQEVLDRPFPKLEITPDNSSHLIRLVNRYTQILDSPAIVEQSLFGSVVSLYEVFVRDFTTELLTLKPEILNQRGNATITYAELIEFDSVEYAKRHFIEKRVDETLRESTLGILKELEKLFSITITSDKDLVRRYARIVERRHLLQHTGGRVNRLYQKRCAEAGWNMEELEAEGDAIQLGPNTFTEALETFYEMGMKLSQVLWRHVLRDSAEREVADNVLIDEQFNAIQDEQWKRALMLGDFALESPCKSHLSSDRYKLMLVINHAQTLKWSGDSAGCLTALKKHDWSSSSLMFRLPVAALQEEWDEAIRLLKENGPSGEVERQHLTDWPVFRDLRVRQEFREEFVSVFGVSLDDAQRKVIEQQAERVDKDRKSKAKAVNED